MSDLIYRTVQNNIITSTGADVNYIEERLSALHIAAGKGHIDITKLLIQAKCNVNILTR